MSMHRLKATEISENELAQEIKRLVQEAEKLFGQSLCKVVQFGSSLGGASSMHLYSDIDLCVILKSGTSHKDYYGRLPISTLIPVDWILANKDEFEEKSLRRHGVFHLINCEGKTLLDKSHGKI